MQSSAAMSFMKKRATTQTLLDHFLKRVDRIESSKEPEPVPSWSGMSGIAACPPSPIADDPSVLPAPTPSPSSSQSLFLPGHPLPPVPLAPLCASSCTVFCVLSRVQLFATPWIVDNEAPLSIGFSRQVYWSGLPFPTPGDLPHPWVKSECPASPAVAGGFFTTEPPGKPSCSVLLYFSRYYIVRLKMFLFFVFVSYILFV